MTSTFRFACFCLVALSCAAGSVFAAGPKKTTHGQEFPTMTYNEFAKLNSADKEVFIDAVRDAMNDLQAKDPSFAQLLMDSALSFGVANADDADHESLLPQCEKSGRVIKKGDTGVCSRLFLDAITSGQYKNCKLNGIPERRDVGGVIPARQYGTISCDNNVIFKLSGYSNNARTYSQKEKKFISDQNQDMDKVKLESALIYNKDNSKAESKPADPAKPGDNGIKSALESKKADPASKEALAKADRTKDDALTAESKKPARCFFAGFAITGGKCSGVTNLCSANRTDTTPSLIAFKETICKDASKGGCNRSLSPATVDEQSKGDVVCNPLLYGLAKDGGVICSPRKKTKSIEGKIEMPSEVCNRKQGTYASAIKAIDDSPKEFDALLASIRNTCGGKFKTKDSNSFADDDSKKAEWTALEKSVGATNKGDLQATCRVLLNRIRALGVFQGKGKAADFSKEQFNNANGVK